MEITLKLNRDFEKTLNQLFDEYGEEFMYINGFFRLELRINALFILRTS